CSSILLAFSMASTATPYIHSLSLHDALPMFNCAQLTPGEMPSGVLPVAAVGTAFRVVVGVAEVEEDHAGRAEDVSDALENGDERSEEHTSELQSRVDLVCRLLLEKKKRRRHI